jgi:hypothetical protein
LCTATTAALLTATPAPAWPQEPPTTIGFGQHSGTFEQAGDLDIYRIGLTEGQDYALGADAPGPASGNWRVKGPTGAILGTASSGYDEAGGFEFRAGRTGTFTIEAEEESRRDGYPLSYTFRLDKDCRGNAKTKCTIKPGSTKTNALSWYLEQDWLKLTNLTRGRFYTATLNFTPAGGREAALLEVANSSGATVASDVQGTENVITLRFKAAANTVFLVVYGEDNGGQGGTYKVSLRKG